MAVTQAALECYLLRPLAGVVHDYLRPIRFTDREIAKAGYGELFDSIESVADGLRGACRNGYVELAQSMIERGAKNFNTGFKKACSGGHYELINLMIAHGADEWYWGLSTSLRSGHRDIADMMADRLKASKDTVPAYNPYSDMLYDAYISGDIDLIQHVIDSYKGIPIDWTNCLDGACLGGHIELVKDILKRGVDAPSIGLWSACYSGRQDIIDLLIAHGANDWHCGAEGAITGGHMDITIAMIGRSGYNQNVLDTGLGIACRRGNAEFVRVMIAHGATDMESAMYYAAVRGNTDIVHILIEHGANDWNTGLWAACQSKRPSIMKIMIAHGATSCMCVQTMAEHIQN